MAQDVFGNYVVGVEESPYTPGDSIIGGGTGSAQLMHGSVADPNGTYFPDDLDADAYYSQDVAGNDNVQFYRWSIADQEWKAISVT